MSTADQTEKVNLPIPSLQVHGITVHRPIAIIEETLEKLQADQAALLVKINAVDSDDVELLHEYGRALLEMHGDIHKWGSPLHSYASYKYPNPESLVKS